MNHEQEFGYLQGKVESIVVDLDQIREDISGVRSELRRLNEWKAQVIGGSIIAAAFISFIINMTVVVVKLL